MAETQNDNDSAVQVRDRGEVENVADSVVNQDADTPQNQNQGQQQQEGSPWKSMIVRMVIFWLVINFFRSKGPTSPTKTENGKEIENGPCSNLFRDGQLMVSYYDTWNFE